MLKKAGYIERYQRTVSDGEGNQATIIEVHIHGTRFGVRLPELYQAMGGIRSACRADTPGG